MEVFPVISGREGEMRGALQPGNVKGEKPRVGKAWPCCLTDAEGLREGRAGPRGTSVKRNVTLTHSSSKPEKRRGRDPVVRRPFVLPVSRTSPSLIQSLQLPCQ